MKTDIVNIARSCCATARLTLLTAALGLALAQPAVGQIFYDTWQAGVPVLDQNSANTGTNSFLSAQPIPNPNMPGQTATFPVYDTTLGNASAYIGMQAPNTTCLWVFGECYGGGFFDELNGSLWLLQVGLSASRHYEPSYYPLAGPKGTGNDWALLYLSALGGAGGGRGATYTAGYAAFNDPFGPNPTATRGNETAGSEHPVFFSRTSLLTPLPRILVDQLIIKNLAPNKTWFAIIYAGQPAQLDAQPTANAINILFKVYGMDITHLYLLYGNGAIRPASPIIAALGGANVANANKGHILLADVFEFANVINILYGPANVNPPGLFFLALDHGGNTAPAGKMGNGGIGVIPSAPGPPADPDANGPPAPDGIGSYTNQPAMPPTPIPGTKSEPLSIGDGALDFNTYTALGDDSGPASTNTSDLWYSYTALFSGPVSATLNNVDFDAYIAAYDSNNLATNADVAYSPAFSPTVTFQTLAGHTYLIQVGSLDGSQGAGTLDFDSVEFTSVAMTPGGVVLQWNGSTNDVINVQWSPSLNPPTWTSFTNNVTSTTGSFTFTDDGSQTGGFAQQRFYQLVVLP